MYKLKLLDHEIRLTIHRSLLNLEALLLIKRHHLAIVARHADPDTFAHAAILLRNILDAVHEPRDELLAPSLALILVQQVNVHCRLVLRQQVRIAVHQQQMRIIRQPRQKRLVDAPVRQEQRLLQVQVIRARHLGRRIKHLRRIRIVCGHKGGDVGAPNAVTHGPAGAVVDNEAGCGREMRILVSPDVRGQPAAGYGR